MSISYNYRHTYIKKYLNKTFFLNTHKTVLELGCGIGIITKHMGKSVQHVTAVDISEENTYIARLLNPNITVICEDILELNLDKTYDLIVLFDVIEHIPNGKLDSLFDVIEKHSHESTSVILTFPDPLFTKYLKEHEPNKLQIVDEIIDIPDLVKCFGKIGYRMTYFNRYGSTSVNHYDIMELRRENIYISKKYRRYVFFPIRVFFKLLAILRFYRIKKAVYLLIGKINVLKLRHLMRKKVNGKSDE